MNNLAITEAKTTTIKMLTGILTPDIGKVNINGYDIVDNPNEAKREFAFVSDDPDMFLKLKGIEYLKFVGKIYNVNEIDLKEAIFKYSELFEMQDVLNDRIESYSHGMRQKIFVIGALIHNPKIWILDEPLTGLDPKSSHTLKQMMREHADRGNIVLFSTHVLEVAEKLCDHLFIINKGKLIYDGLMVDLKKTKDNSFEMVVQVTGKVRGKIEVSMETSKEEMETLSKELENVKIYQFKNSDLDSQHKIILTYADLGINTNVNVVIQNSAGNIANNENFVKWSWENSYLTIQFVDFQSNIIGNQNLTDTWRIKYLLNGNIKQNIKSQTKQYTITLNGDNVFQNNYSVIYDGTKVYVNHNSNNYSDKTLQLIV